MSRILPLFTILLTFPLCLTAQEHISGTVGGDAPYTDLVQCDIDDQGLDLNVRVAFDEESNRVTVSVSSPRQLFAFSDMCRHRDVFKGWGGRRKLRIDRLPGNRLVEHNSSYRMAGSVVHKFRKPRHNHVYLPWLRTDHAERLTPSDRLLPDSLVETFTIPGNTREVEFTLRTILVAERSNGLPAVLPVPDVDKGKRKRFRFVAECDLRRTYHIVILRDPCLYTSNEVAEMQQQVGLLRDEWRNIRDTYPAETPVTPEAHDLLNKSKAYVALRYHAVTDTTDCATLGALYVEHNALLDSIGHHDCPIVQPTDESVAKSIVGINPENILAQAHRIDSNVARYLVSRLPQEKSDLSRECRKIIADTQNLINANGIADEEQQRAVNVFNQSVAYYYKICKH